MLGWRLPRRIARPGVVTSTVSAARRPVRAEPRSVGAALGEGGLDVAADGVGDGADARPVVGRERPDPAQDGRQATLLAEDVDIERLERRDVAGRRDRREGVVAQRLEFAGQVRQVHGLPLRIVLPGITSPRASSTSRAPVPGSRLTPARRRAPATRRSWRAPRSSRRSPRPGWPGRPGSCGRSRRRPS